MSGPAWIYDGSEIADPFGYGERAMVFLKLLKHPKSRAPDRALIIDPWQDRIVRRIYGPCGENGRRITRVVYLQVGRGNRRDSSSPDDYRAIDACKLFTKPLNGLKTTFPKSSETNPF